MSIIAARIIESSELLADIYRTYAKRILDKVDSIDFKLFIMLMFQEDDITQELNNLKRAMNVYEKYLEKNDLHSAYIAYKYIIQKGGELENKIIERIMALLKLYSFYLYKEKYSKDN